VGPCPSPALAAPPAAGDEPVLLDVARLDASGRFTSRPLMRTLGWAAGHRIGLQVRADAVVLTTDPAGTLAVGSRGELAIPAPARTMPASTATPASCSSLSRPARR
jgi:hypothetical protein